MLQLQIVAIQWTNTPYVKHDNKSNLSNTSTQKTELLPYLQQASDKWHNTDTIQATYYGSVYTSGSRRAVSDIKRR